MNTRGGTTPLDLADKFTASAERARKVAVQPKQVRFPFGGNSAGFGNRQRRVLSDLDLRVVVVVAAGVELVSEQEVMIPDTSKYYARL
ncbi:hypothetical protein ABZP36_021503 [Zizania latifolia]